MKKIIGILLFIISIVVILFIIINNIPEKNASKIPIVTFHRLVPDNIKNTKYKENVWVGSIDIFESMMKYISDNNYKTTDNITTFTSIGIIGIVVLSYIFEVFPMIINENKDINKTRTILSVIPPNVIYEIIRNQNSKENNVSLKN